ncbi:glycine oxidase [Anoxybacillus vitaminiphilus]|uniref:Aerobic glycerol-3-phosphate dehydrogenase n=1 Tax=Paranoxybacillus vitaminiphilus TaxID=581036 RepID=A0A327YI53_9BACL|nr:glycine oxidase ThiO [Anoxybacillus vitaminiphilus]RAK19445.1 glycine oxidase [Anoxybacillus vitaminiphilus]
MNKIYDVVIVGGGVIGCSIAFQLAKRGLCVIVLEKERIANEASSAAAGMLGAQSEFSGDSPMIPLALKSREMFSELAAELKELTGMDIGFIQKGLVKLAFTEHELNELQQQYQFWRTRDASVRWLTAKELCELEPNVTEDISGAMYIPNDGQVDAADLSHALAKAAAIYGAEIREYTEVYSLLLRNDQACGVVTNSGTIYGNTVVVAAGAWSAHLLKQTGIELNMYPVKGECFSVVTEQPLLQATMFAKNGCYIVPKRGNRLLIGATSTPNTFNKHVSVQGVYSLLERAQQMMPKLAEAKWEKMWAGIRPQTGDGLPYIGEHPRCSGLWVAAGHYRNGILLSPVTGVLLADFIIKEKTDIDISSFSLIRKVTCIT